MLADNELRLAETRHYWDKAAATFDDEPDHGLRDATVRAAWVNLLANWLPSAHSTILDIGCGTGSLSGVLAAFGHDVTGIDLSPAMIAQATAKAQAAGQSITFKVMQASDPPLSPQHFDLIVCRHLLWALPEPALALQRWVKLLAPGGRLLLIEGYWHTGGGLHAAEVMAMLPATLTGITMQNLSDQPALWGGAVVDERYIVSAELPATAVV